mmetsp:Transcript_13735/g.28366  ORF Transcript_13735/g.28366 Transcript_13735/m.28366 type:complete len:324 (-) Transcript_13735:189-1160(-)|eukprot:CAMPEP_0172449226 /NCGR_PEP_ID=MMETSP1065-20121228/7980_1 /TAXON_ID=265537 /ORGANISM="Amphiprora paludosa, Strain CCMP125" /LENGTH=323 /DNA_ID=CAMNT_0013200851 /DNA_START=98 /DNA_END=1069 /DNA_ORIENTATION=+
MTMVNPSNHRDINSTLETLAAMCRQEENYQATDFLHQDQSMATSICSVGPLNEDSSSVMDIDEDCRTKMVAWCYRVVDFCKFDHETVAIAMSILDRFMSCPNGSSTKTNRRAYQLAAMTSLYTAVKVHEPEAMDPTLVSKISHGTYTEKEVEAMEMQILQGVSWRVNGPTALSFVRQCLDLIHENDLDIDTREMVYSLAQTQTELALAEYEFVSVKPSVVAYCSLMNALTLVGVDDVIVQSVLVVLAQVILPTNSNLPLIANVQTWLYGSLVLQPTTQTILEQAAGCMGDAEMNDDANNESILMGVKNSPHTSPRSVSTTASL